MENPTQKQIDEAKKLIEQQKKLMRYSENEISLIRNTFLDNDKILKAIRKVFLQLPLDNGDEAELAVFKGHKDLMKVMRKTFLPELDGNAPLNQNVDLWMTVQIADKTPAEAYPHIVARAKLILYIKQRLMALEGLMDSEMIIFENLTIKEDLPTADLAYVNLIVRNIVVNHTEQMLVQLEDLANIKEETPEEVAKKINMDSNQ
jgi:hypothetical protein